MELWLGRNIVQNCEEKSRRKFELDCSELEPDIGDCDKVQMHGCLR